MSGKPSHQEVIQSQYNAYKANLQQVAQKIVDLETDLDEHKLVIDTLEKTDKDRKCYRMINGVLAERKVETVLPILQTTSNGIKTAMERLVEQYKQLEKEFNEFQKKNHIQVIRQ